MNTYLGENHAFGAPENIVATQCPICQFAAQKSKFTNCYLLRRILLARRAKSFKGKFAIIIWQFFHHLLEVQEDDRKITKFSLDLN